MNLKKLTALFILAAFMSLNTAFDLSAEPVKVDPNKYVDILLDASGSMQAKIGSETKIAIAKRVLAEIVDGMKGREDLLIGVRVYGHQFDKSAKNCQDTNLELQFGNPDPAKIRSLITRIKAQGQTPIAYSLTQARKDFQEKTGVQKIIILITDGLESCEGDPCAAARALAAKGVDVKMHVVGFDLKSGELDKLKCLVSPSAGLLLGAKDAGELKSAIDQVVKKSIKENLIINLLGEDGKPIAGYVELYAGDKKVDAASTTGADSVGKAMLRLPSGTYDIMAQSHVTSQKQWMRGINVTDDQVTEKTISFAAGKISAIAKGTNGAPVEGYITVLQNDGVDDKFINAGSSRAEPAVFNVVPGTYKIKIEHARTKEVKILDGLQIMAGQSISKEASFAEGSVSSIAKDMAGNPIAALFEVKRLPDDIFVRAGESGAQPFVFYLTPGNYRFVATNNKTKEVKNIDAVNVADGQSIAKEVSFGHGRLSVIAKGSSAAAVPATIEVIWMNRPEGQRTMYLEDSGAEPKIFTVPPGTYKIIAKDKATGTTKSLENIIIGDGQEIKKEVSLY